MSKKPDKRRGAVTDSPLLPKLKAILKNYEALKAEADQNNDLESRCEKMFRSDPYTTIPAYQERGKTIPAQVVNRGANYRPFQDELRRLRIHIADLDAHLWSRQKIMLMGGQPTIDDLRAKHAAYEAARKEADQRSVEEKEFLNGIDPEDERARILGKMGKLDSRMEKILLAKPRGDTCLFIKAQLIGLFVAYDLRNEENLNGEPDVSSQSLLTATAALMDRLAKSCPRAAEINTMIEGIRASMPLWPLSY